MDVNTICVSPGMFTVGPINLLRVVTLGVLCGEGESTCVLNSLYSVYDKYA